MKSNDKKDLLVAYSVKRKNRKKYAEGGKVKDKPLTVKDDSSGDIINVPKKPGVMDYVKEAFQDSGTRANIDAARKRTGMAEGGPVKPGPNSAKMKSHNSGNKALIDSRSDDDPTVRQAQKPSTTKLSQPRIIGGDTFSSRNHDQRDENNNQMKAFAPSSDRDQPQKRYDEVGANRQGPTVPDMAKQHNNQRSAYEMAVEHEYAQDIANANMKKVQSLARGGMIDADEQPQPEADEERHASVAAAIMAKKAMAEGGEIEHEGDELLEDGQVDLDDNAREIPNQFYHMNEHEALEENFDEDIMKMSQPEDSNLQDVEISSDKHDRIAQMRSKMRSKRGLR